MAKTTDKNYRFQHAGDRGLIVAFAEADSSADANAIRRRLRDLAQRLLAAAKAGQVVGLVECVPGMANLLLVYDATTTTADQLMTQVANIPPRQLGKDSQTQPSRVIDMPCCYEGEFAPDLATSATSLGISEAQLISRHTECMFEVAMMGFLPGLAYMVGLDESLALPRRDSPRQRVPEGSVGIVQNQTTIYPLTSPGGWNLIGRVPRRLFAPDRSDPILLRPADRVKFHAISRTEYDRLYQAARPGDQHG